MTATRELPVLDATAELVAPYGRLITDDVTADIDIPYYRGRVVEGGDIGFEYRGAATLRTAKVLPGADSTVLWLERHLYLTQLFVGLGTEPFVMVLAPPNHETGGDLPDLDAARALRIPAATGLLLHRGTWHDFPIACRGPVTFLLGNSAEVIDALRAAGTARELDQGDVYKISLPDRLATRLKVLL